MRITTLALSAALLMPLAAGAEEGSVRAVTDPVVKKECGACHMTYQPGFLPAASWQRIVATLDDHFGEDASLDEAARKQIEDYLVAHAGRRKADAANPPMRITGLGWFRNEHGGSGMQRLARKRGAKTMSDCAACHRGAEAGQFDDD